jgi:hypothetical protein
MLWNKLTFLLATLALLFPSVAIANEIDVRTGNVRVSTYQNGGVYVQSGKTKVEVPAYSTPQRRWNSLGWLRLPWGVSCRSSHNSVYQRTTQTSESHNGVVHRSSVSTQNCR